MTECKCPKKGTENQCEDCGKYLLYKKLGERDNWCDCDSEEVTKGMAECACPNKGTENQCLDCGEAYIDCCFVGKKGRVDKNCYNCHDLKEAEGSD